MDKVLMTGGQMLKFLEFLEQHGTTPEHVQRVLGSGLLPLLFDEEAEVSSDSETRAAVRAALGLAPELFNFSFDRGQSIGEMIDGDPRLSVMLNNDERIFVSKNLRTSGTGIVECQAHYFQFNEEFSDEKEPIRRIKSWGLSWLPAEIQHLLAFVRAFPEEARRKYFIMALGSVVKMKGERCAPRVYNTTNWEKPYSLQLGNKIYPRTRLLAIREISPAK